MFDVEYGDLSAIASRVVWDRSRKEGDCRPTRFGDKRTGKKTKQDEMKETPDTIWVFVNFIHYGAFGWEIH